MESVSGPAGPSTPTRNDELQRGQRPGSPTTVGESIEQGRNGSSNINPSRGGASVNTTPTVSFPGLIEFDTPTVTRDSLPLSMGFPAPAVSVATKWLPFSSPFKTVHGSRTRATTGVPKEYTTMLVPPIIPSTPTSHNYNR